jgi:signal peptidase I
VSRKNDQGGRSAGRRRRADEAADEAELSPLGRLWEQLGPILLAVVIALGIRAVIIESYYVPSGSMLPTMFIGDHVFVSKFTYGAKVPFTDWRLPAVRDPERGEIVVFELGRGPQGICPLHECPDLPGDGFVKRVVGLPGDEVSYRGGVLYVNGEAVPAEPTGEEFTDDKGARNRVLVEELDGCPHAVLDNPSGSGLTQPSFVIPDDQYFMMGDNRDNSSDSRKWGTVHRHHLKGPVLINYWAWNNTYSWPQMLNPINWLKLLFGEMHWDRIGMTYACEAPEASESSAGIVGHLDPTEAARRWPGRTLR